MIAIGGQSLRTQTETITLTCHHTYLGPPASPGAEYYCLRCGKYEHVVTSASRYTWRCSTCGFQRTYQSRRLYGEGMAMRHHQQNRTHKVTYVDSTGKILWQSIPRDYTQLELPLDDETIPF